MERRYELQPEIGTQIDTEALDGADVAIVPDNFLTTAEGLVAGYRTDTQSVRVFLGSRGLKVVLATPPGARAASYEEHDATWVLPLVLGIPASVVSGVLTSYMTDWLKRQREQIADEEAPAISVQYREAELDPSTGRILVREIQAPVDELIKVLEASRRESLPPS
jgi:hypothetical protein